MPSRSAATPLRRVSAVAPRGAVAPRLWSVGDDVPDAAAPANATECRSGEATEPAARPPAVCRGVVIIDADPLTRAGMRTMLARHEESRQVADVGDLAEARVRLPTLRPQVALMEAALAAEDGAAGLRTVLGVLPTLRVIAFGTGSREEEIFRVFEAGARGYLLREAAEAELSTAIRCVEEGGCYLPPQVEAALQRRRARRELTPRETDVVGLLAQARSNAAIAAALGISAGTVKLHVKSIMAKLDVEDRAQAALVAIERGFARLT